mgnify:CR=1 FL=1
MLSFMPSLPAYVPLTGTGTGKLASFALCSSPLLRLQPSSAAPGRRDDALGSNNPWYVLEALTVTEWDGNTSYFNIQINVSDEQENTGGLTIDYQSNRVRPRFYGSDNVIYTYSSNGQHLLTLACYGRSSTIKVLFRVTSDWSS